MLCIIDFTHFKFYDVIKKKYFALLKLIEKIKVSLLLANNGTNILNASAISALIEFLTRLYTGLMSSLIVTATLLKTLYYFNVLSFHHHLWQAGLTVVTIKLVILDGGHHHKASLNVVGLGDVCI